MTGRRYAGSGLARRLGRTSDARSSGVVFPAITFGSVQTVADRNWASVAYSQPQTRWVRSGSNEARTVGYIEYSDDGGLTWTPVSTDVTSHRWDKVIWAPVNAVFVALSHYKGTSPDGTSKVAVSADGDSWTIYGMPTAGVSSAHWRGCCELNDGKLLACGANNDPTPQFARSLDGGPTWVGSAASQAGYWTAAVTDGTNVVNVFAGGPYVAKSTNAGVSYTEYSLSADPNAYGNDGAWSPTLSKFGIMGGSDAACDFWDSSNGQTWTHRTLPSQEYMYVVSWIPAATPFFLSLVGDPSDGTYTAFASYNGADWAGSNPSIAFGYQAMAYNATSGRIVAVAYTGKTVTADVG